MTDRVVARFTAMSRLHTARGDKADCPAGESAARKADARLMAQIKALSDRVWTEPDTGPIAPVERDGAGEDGA
jgi:hypothetical protein